MVRLRTVKESAVQDVASEYIEGLTEEERRPKLKSNALGPSLKNATDEVRAFVRTMGL